MGESIEVVMPKDVRFRGSNTPITQPVVTDTTAKTGTTGAAPVQAVLPNAPSTSGAAAARADVDQKLAQLGGDLGALRKSTADAFTQLGVGAPKPAVQEPSIQKLYQDPQFKALHGFVMGEIKRVSNEHREWDKLGQIRAFVAAASFVMKGQALDGSGAAEGKPLYQRFTGAQERRAMAHLLLLTMPKEWRTERPMRFDGTRGTEQSLFNPLPDSVIARADSGFQLAKGDLPSVAPIFTRHLRAPDLLDKIFTKGQHGIFLASKSYCPGAFLQDRADINPPNKPRTQQVGHMGDPIMVRVEDVIEVDGQKMARVSVPDQHKWWLGDGGKCTMGERVFPGTDVVIDTSGRPVLGADGKPKPILIPVAHLADYLLDPGKGTGAGGLDLTKEEDRAVALTFSAGLKSTYLTDSSGITKSLFDWLEKADERTPRKDVDRIKEAVREAAYQSIAKYACHPRRTHFKIDLGPNEGDWQHEAYKALESTGIMSDCGNRYEKDKSNTQHVHEMAWTGSFLGRGFVGGSLDCYGLAHAFDKLSATFLAPLGILGTTGIAEGHGAEIMRVLGSPDEKGVIQAGVPMKSKLNELIVGLNVPISSGRGPEAEYMENWGGYLKVAGPSGQRVDFGQRIQRAEAAVKALG